MGVAPEIGVQRERDKVFVDVVGFDLIAGEPPGAV